VGGTTYATPPIPISGISICSAAAYGSAWTPYGNGFHNSAGIWFPTWSTNTASVLVNGFYYIA
jgi:hypothetical protein